MKTDDIDTVMEVMEAPRYAVAVELDQTIAYVCQNNRDITIRHPEAGLWDTEEEAHAAAKSMGNAIGDYDLEEVRDEDEFRSRDDTW